MNGNLRYPYFNGLNASNIKDFIVSYREANDITLDQMAYETGISRATLNRLEKGEANPTLKTINALNKFITKVVQQSKTINVAIAAHNTLHNIIDNLKIYLSQLELDLIHNDSESFVVDRHGNKFPLTETEIREIDDSILFQIEVQLEYLNVKIPFPSWLIANEDNRKES